MDAVTRATFDEVARTFETSLRAAQRLEAAINNSREDIDELREEVASLGAKVDSLWRRASPDPSPGDPVAQSRGRVKW